MQRLRMTGYYSLLGWIHWYNTGSLHGYLGDVPSTEFEQAFDADRINHSQLVGVT